MKFFAISVVIRKKIANFAEVSEIDKLVWVQK